ncbi:hydrogenase large subunit [Thermococcus sp. MV5]|uniref:NADH-quinone oxidoreductase subunit D-related protein n=1 Tax=Thermococcus sp. MV5 TaxID=1638272 RepID=UPI00143B0BF2|nr:hydrogenase large subunit [Thermococcus sp. MV5]
MILEILKSNNAKILRHDEKVTVALIPNDKLRTTSELLFKAGCYYATGAGVDERLLGVGFSVYHIFNCEAEGRYIIIKAVASNLRIPSITPIISGANWAEREVMDMLGIFFDEHPEPLRLILPDDWPEGVYPLRKDFHYNERPPRVEFKQKREKKPGVIEVPVGPYHPALHEPEVFELCVKGEEIVGAVYRGFHVHRGMEKLAEGRMTINQIPFLAERICGICGYTHNCAYVQAIEDAAKIEVPERALYIRTILLELERVHSHMLWLGVAFHLLGFESGFMHTWRIRETFMDLAELLTGNRKTYGMNLIGGVRRDIDENKKKRLLEILDKTKKDIREIFDNATQMRELINRMKGIGVLSKKEGREIGVVGPTARGSDIDTDVRRDHPYAAYGDLEFKVPVYKDGDVLSRFLVRYEEVLESIWLIEQALDQLPPGDILNEDYELPEYTICVGATEAPRGEDVHFAIMGEGNRVYRWHPRAPTYNNLPAVPIMLKGEKLADAPIIIASIDPCFSCTDHIVIVDGEKVYRCSLDNYLGGL